MNLSATQLDHSINYWQIFRSCKLERVSDGKIVPILEGVSANTRLMLLVLPQLGDFDSLEYAWWLQKESKQLQEKKIAIGAIAIGNRHSGLRFCEYSQFPSDCLFVDPCAATHRQLGLYQGLTWKYPLLSPSQTAWINLMLMCAGIGSPKTLREVLRGYRGDRNAPQLISDDQVIHAKPLPPLKGSFFNLAGGKGFQRPFELATLRLRNMTEVLNHWQTYVPDASYLTQRGGTFLFDAQGNLIYQHLDRGILGFAENMTCPLSFLKTLETF